ncbi:5-oxoprolinase subunit PxpA [Curtobacterium sp. MCLR17_007]|uniref:LamB/YcsF family protein n=1 Tax=Curtobacterium sp. MCLR17_007 TaxID=2175648 RepID=UPI000DAA0E5B|nr:5-oxoprolinase subunit PxpA [Curtobacterium sp. MCLR17_007]WIB59625.1 5-oxoprolinase subunit PxpA [Curtobacterium sp. MCLR17_007]
MTTIDLNSDLGEGYGAWPMGDDPAMLDVVSSANIACGAHAGDPVIMLATARAAAARGVAVGAHVAYRDLAGFGRRPVHVTPDELYADVVHQLGAMTAAAHVAGTAVTYVKPHGALYNTACADPVQAEAVVRAVADVDPTLAVLALPDSELLHAADRRGLRAVSESFADRAYEPDGSLVSRSTPGSVLHDPDQVAARVLRMVTDGVATAIDGSEIRVRAESVCVHGDSPSAVAMARAIRTLLTTQGVGIAPFAPVAPAVPVVPVVPVVP